jgi:hypothetical protein
MPERSSRLLVIGTASALVTVVAIVAVVWIVFGISNAHEVLGIRPTPCPECADVDFVLDGAIQKGSLDAATLTLKAADGTTATFDNAKVTITTIPSETAT